MKPVLSYLFVATNSVQDINSKKFTFIDIFSLIYILKDQPFTLHNFVVGGRIFGLTPGRFTGIVKVIDPTGVTLQSSTLEGEIKFGDLSFSAAFNLVKIEKTGRHFLRFSFNGEDLLDENRYFFEALRL